VEEANKESNKKTKRKAVQPKRGEKLAKEKLRTKINSSFKRIEWELRENRKK